jgi:hypothetical protein
MRPDATAQNTPLDDGYRAMAADTAREAEARQWCNALAFASSFPRRLGPRGNDDGKVAPDIQS